MNKFLDLSHVAPAFYARHGLIPITDEVAEGLKGEDGKHEGLVFRVYGGQDGEDEPPFEVIEVMA